MNRVVFYCMFLFVIFCSCNSKTVDKTAAANNDSIKKYLKLAGNDTIAFTKRILYNDKAYSLIDLNKNDSLTRFHLYCVSYKYAYFVKNNLLKSTAEKLMALSIKSKDSLNIGRANRNLGLYYIAISDNEKAILYFFTAKKIFKSLKRMDYFIKTMSSIADTQYYASDFLGSNKTSIEMISLSTKAKFKGLNSRALINIGDNLAALNNSLEAINYYKRAIKATKVKNSINGLYNSISERYMLLKQYDSASKYVNLNLNNKKLLSINPTEYSKAVSLNAVIKLEKKQYNKLEEEFRLADYYFNLFNSQYGRNYNQIYLSKYYDKVNNNKKAIDAAYKALKLSEEYKNSNDILASLNQLIKVDKRNASAHAQQYIRIKDSMQIAERNFRDKFARIAFETEEITQERETAIKQKWIITSIGGFIVLVVILLLIITRQRSKQKELQFLQSQQKTNEEIYDLMLFQKNKEDLARQNEKKRIAIELHDGVMNKLASTRLNLSLLSHKKDQQTIEKCLTHVEAIYLIEQEIRSIAHNLNQDIFIENNSFISLLNDFVANHNDVTSTQYQLEIDELIDWGIISSSVKMNLYRIIQEASHNINKFAQAKNANISFMLDGNNLCLSITDDGKGFDVEKQTDGIGLKNIKQRIETLNGKFVIQSLNNQNTSLNISIPLK